MYNFELQEGSILVDFDTEVIDNTGNKVKA